MKVFLKGGHMNYKVLKDVKAVSGFISAIILSLIGVVLAIKSHRFWVAFVVLSIIILFLSAHRADKVMESE